MRVISGTAKGKKLKAPAGCDTRPITDRIKEALFNVIGPDIRDARFLDLFAGSGSVGIEALSRGAELVILVDSGKEAIRTIHCNLQTCGFNKDYEVYRQDVFAAIRALLRREIKFDLIYIDPPFTVEKLFEQVLTTLNEQIILKPDGIIIIRAPRRKSLPLLFENLQCYRVNDYGESTLYYYHLIN
ncbi:MAG: 16S rRNA (guanine(966)-N(2))-methyltransferase RsmD [Syntrophomonadaceae bacterium]